MVVRGKADGSQVAEPMLQLNSSANKFEALPLRIGDASDQLIPLAFGTGFRNASSLANVMATIGGVIADLTFAGTQGAFVGLERAKIRIPSRLGGRSEVNVVATVDGKDANLVAIKVK